LSDLAQLPNQEFIMSASFVFGSFLANTVFKIADVSVGTARLAAKTASTAAAVTKHAGVEFAAGVSAVREERATPVAPVRKRKAVAKPAKPVARARTRTRTA
jgi:hypothetical protein